MSDLRAAVVHFTPAFGEVSANRQALVELSLEAASAGARVVVLPELATTGFCLSPEQARAWAEEPTGPTVSALAEVSRDRGLVVVAGLALRDGERLLNAQVVIDGGRLAGRYAKHHLYGADHGWATAGDLAGAVVATSVGPLGLLICHDITYPATVLAVAMQAPRLVAFSTAWIGGGEAVPIAWLFAAEALAPAALLVANRGGREGSVSFDDPSAILSYDRGGVLGPRGGDARVLTFDLAGSAS